MKRTLYLFVYPTPSPLAALSSFALVSPSFLVAPLSPVAFTTRGARSQFARGPSLYQRAALAFFLLSLDRLSWFSFLLA